MRPYVMADVTCISPFRSVCRIGTSVVREHLLLFLDVVQILAHLVTWVMLYMVLQWDGNRHILCYHIELSLDPRSKM